MYTFAWTKVEAPMLSSQFWKVVFLKAPVAVRLVSAGKPAWGQRLKGVEGRSKLRSSTPGTGDFASAGCVD